MYRYDIYRYDIGYNTHFVHWKWVLNFMGMFISMLQFSSHGHLKLNQSYSFYFPSWNESQSPYWITSTMCHQHTLKIAHLKSLTPHLNVPQKSSSAQLALQDKHSSRPWYSNVVHSPVRQGKAESKCGQEGKMVQSRSVCKGPTLISTPQ